MSTSLTFGAANISSPADLVSVLFTRNVPICLQSWQHFKETTNQRTWPWVWKKKKKLTPKPQSSKHKFPGGEPWTKKNVLRWNRRWRPNSRLFLVTRASSVIRLQLDTSSWPHWCQENSYHYKLQLSRTRNFRKFGRRSPADSSPLNSLNWFQMHSSWLKCEMCYHKHQPIFQW